MEGWHVFTLFLLLLTVVLPLIRTPSRVAKSKPSKLLGLRTHLKPSAALRAVASAGESGKFKVELVDEDNHRVVLSTPRGGGSWGFYYPIFISTPESDMTLVEVGIVSMVIQVGPVVTRNLDACLAEVEASVRAAETFDETLKDTAIREVPGSDEVRQSELLSSPSQQTQVTRAWGEVPLRFLRYLVGEPKGIRDKYLDQGPAKASIAASVYSLALLGAAVAWSILFTVAALPVAIASQVAPSDALTIALNIPALVALLFMLLSLMAGMALSVLSFFSKRARKRDAFRAFILSIVLLLSYAMFGLLTIGTA